MAKTLAKNIRVLKLELRLITHADGRVVIDANLTHKCKDKQTAIELIEDYVNQTKRDKESVKA